MNATEWGGERVERKRSIIKDRSSNFNKIPIGAIQLISILVRYPTTAICLIKIPRVWERNSLILEAYASDHRDRCSWRNLWAWRARATPV